MSEKEPHGRELHPLIEENIVTSGVDMGRMKNTDIAWDMAEIENGYFDNYRYNGGTPSEASLRYAEKHGDRVDKMIGRRLGREAVEGSGLVESVISDVINERGADTTTEAVEKAKVAVHRVDEDYTTLMQRVRKRNADAYADAQRNKDR